MCWYVVNINRLKIISDLFHQKHNTIYNAFFIINTPKGDMFRFLKNHPQANSNHFDIEHSVCAYVMGYLAVYSSV
jgi:hypothetical protein